MIVKVQEKIPIYTAADWAYRGPLTVMLASLDRHLPEGVVVAVRILTLADSAEQYKRHPWPAFRRLRLEYLELNTDALVDIPVYGHTGILTYARLLLDRLDLCSEPRALYLDADILVRGNIFPILDALRLCATPLAAVREVGTDTVARNGGVFNWADLGLRGDEPYFNAGVLGLNLDMIREERLFTRALAYLVKHGRKVRSWDQGALNAVAVTRVTLWPATWNFTTSMLKASARARVEMHGGAFLPDYSEAIIAHFTGSGACNPWTANSFSPFRMEYRVYALMVGFPTDQLGRLERKIGLDLACVLRRIACFGAGYGVGGLIEDGTRSPFSKRLI